MKYLSKRMGWMCLLVVAVAGLVSSAARADALAVYTNRNQGLVGPLLEVFSKASDIRLNVVYGQEALAERLSAGERFDVYLSGDVHSLEAARRAGLLSYSLKDLSISVPEELRSDDGSWMALTLRARGFYVRVDGEMESTPTYEDLARLIWKGRICSRPLSHRYNKALIAAHLLHHGVEATRRWLADLSDNVLIVSEGGDRAVAAAVAERKCDIGIGHSYYLGLLQRDPRSAGWSSRLRMSFPSFVPGGTHFDITGIGVLDGSEHKDAALALADWLIGDDAQEIYAAFTAEYRASKGFEDIDHGGSGPRVVPDTIPLGTIADVSDEVDKLIIEMGL